MGAVPIECLDVEEIGPLDHRLVARVNQPRAQILIQRTHLSARENLEPLALRLIQEEECDATVIPNVTGADVLHVAAEVGETEQLGTQQAKKAFGPTAEL